ncbi:hypothetical protein BT69DRAFT_773141 [Atractiella rhizophila]|nr:hypothetical protein BT69DRAFT_773141 [Atractiella rhizophila]
MDRDGGATSLMWHCNQYHFSDKQYGDTLPHQLRIHDACFYFQPVVLTSCPPRLMSFTIATLPLHSICGLLTHSIQQYGRIFDVEIYCLIHTLNISNLALSPQFAGWYSLASFSVVSFNAPLSTLPFHETTPLSSSVRPAIRVCVVFTTSNSQ